MKNGTSIEEQKYRVELVFKTIEPGQVLREEERQLLLAYMGEILKEIEEEEKVLCTSSTIAGE